MLRSISLSKRSCSFSCAWRRYHLHSVRKNHSAATVNSQSVEASEGLFLKDYNPVWSSTAPLTELVSLDDFGISTVQQLMPSSNEKEIPLHKFLDHLMRSFPTTAEPVELGGTLELNDLERDSLETALSEGIDISAVIRELSIDGETDPILIVRPPKRRPDLNAIPAASIVAVSSAINITSNSTTAKPAPLPRLEVNSQVPSTSYAQSMVPAEEQYELGLVEELLEAVETQNGAFLRTFKHKSWPKASELGNATNKVLRFVITKSETAKEAFGYLENFFEVNPTYFLRDDLILPLGVREIEESGLKSAIEMLKKSRLLSFTRSNIRANRPSYSEFLQLFSVALERGQFSETMKLYEELSNLNFIHSHQEIRALVQSVLEKFEPTKQIISQWIRISTSTSQTEGVDLLWDKLISQDSFSPENIGIILRHSQKIDHAYTALSELICALVRNNKVEQAKVVFSKVYLTGNFLHRPLKRLVAKGDLESVEKIADLISSYLFDEKKRGRNRTLEKIPDTSKVFSDAIDKFIGSNGKKPYTPKSYEKKDQKKPKRHKVDENQLYGVAICIRNAWFKLAKDADSQLRLRLWCERNSIEKLT